MYENSYRAGFKEEELAEATDLVKKSLSLENASDREIHQFRKQ